MRFMRWNSFTVIGLILIALGIYGLIKGSGFQFDAGLPPKPLDGFYYLVVGVLMFVNGIVTSPALDEPEVESEKASIPAK